MAYPPLGLQCLRALHRTRIAGSGLVPDREEAASAEGDRFSARRGTYTVIYPIDDKAPVVTVVDVAHRRDVYRT
jgi:hypothetical protein